MLSVDHAGESINKVRKAIDEIKNGKFVLMYDADDREGEADFIMAAEFVTPQAIQCMRKQGGGLIFLMISNDVAQKIQLPFFSDVLSTSEKQFPLFKKLIANDIPYDTRSSFSISINHRKTFTGITDNDRSLTIRQFAHFVTQMQAYNEKDLLENFGKEFRSPGHVPICISSESPLKNRFGHTELSIALLTMAEMTPVATGCEIMGDNGKALAKEDVKILAEKHNLLYIEGDTIIRSWNDWLK